METQEARIALESTFDRCTLFDINYQPSRMSVEQLRDGFHLLAKDLYSEAATKWRRDNFNHKYLRPADG